MTQVSTENLYAQYKERMRRIADVRYASAVLQWDQETYLPSKGASFRGQQIASLSEIAHQLFTDVNLGTLLEELSLRNNLNSFQKCNIERSSEDYLKQQKFSTGFVRKLAETTQKSFHSWIAARAQNNFKPFQDDLSNLIELKKEEAALLGYSSHPYDALLNDHDKGSTTQLLDGLFDSIRNPLKELFDRIMARPQVKDDFLFQFFPKQLQWDFGLEVLRDIGYDFEAGRQDLAEHPFTTSFNCKDVRVTTRIDENNLGSMIWSCIHEGGHALYEQGLPESEYGLPMGEAASYSIHESQSRLWENHIGRSLQFCEKYLPRLQQSFPQQLENISVIDFYKGINKVQPSFIRTEADELTYHFHVLIRYEIEKGLIEGSIQTKDIPAYWNELYYTYFKLKIPDDRSGCLQDVHWSHGSFGYFPTYTQGSFYGAQFHASALKEKNNKNEKQISNEDNKALLKWLHKEVYEYGRMYTSEELCLKISGETLNTQYLLDYLLAKYDNIYQF
ncbi:MAG: carboxypeptidase M32 [Chitinophagaceae bacterium]